MKRRWSALAGAAGALVLAPLAVGALLPSNGSTTRSEAFPTSIERLWPIVLAEFSRRNDGAYAIAESAPPHRLRTTVVDTTLPFRGEWIYELEPFGEGTRLTIVENSTIPNPLVRFAARFILNRKRAIDDYLLDVRRASLSSAEA
jgi:hypothetical protein